MARDRDEDNEDMEEGDEGRCLEASDGEGAVLKVCEGYSQEMLNRDGSGGDLEHR